MYDLKKVIISDFLGSFSVSALMTYAYWFIYNQTHSQLAISVLGTVSMIALLFAFVGGYITDHHSKVNLLRIVATFRLVIMVLGSISILLNFNRVYAVFCVVILDSLLGVVYAPLTEAIAPTLVPDSDDLFKANSWVSATNQIASISSSLLAVVFVYLKQPIFALATASTSCIISLIFLIKITKDPVPKNPQKFHLQIEIARFAQGLRLATSNPIIKFMIPIAVVINFCYWSIWLLMPKFSIEVFARYGYTYNLIDSSLTIGGIIGAFVFSKLYHAKESTRLFPYFLVGQALTLVLLGLNAGHDPSIYNVIFVGISWAGYGFCNSIFSIIYFSIIQISTNPNQMGTIIGSVLTIFSISNPVAALINTPLSHIASVQTLIIFLSAIMLISSIPVFSHTFRREINIFDKR